MKDLSKTFEDLIYISEATKVKPHILGNFKPKSDLGYFMKAYIGFWIKRLDIEKYQPRVMITRLKKGQYGHVKSRDIKKGGNKIGLEIYINKTLGLHYMLNAIAHELTHIKQFVAGEFYDLGRELYWKGKKRMTVKEYNETVDMDEYKKIPWEKEAYNNGENGIKIFLSSEVPEELIKTHNNHVMKIIIDTL